MKDSSSVGEKEMEKREDKDVIASLKMVGEGGPNYNQPPKKDEQDKEQGEEEKLPETFQ